MDVRAILQVEIWSEQRSRKILQAIWKTVSRLKFVWIGIGVIATVFGLWFFTWTHWLTEGERSRGKIALVQVDELQDIYGLSDVEFNARSHRAQEKVNEAVGAALTYDDKATAGFVTFYLYQVKSINENRKTREQIYSRSNARPEVIKEWLSKDRKSDDALIKIVRDAVHESLDK